MYFNVFYLLKKNYTLIKVKFNKTFYFVETNNSLFLLFNFFILKKTTCIIKKRFPFSTLLKKKK